MVSKYCNPHCAPSTANTILIVNNVMSPPLYPSPPHPVCPLWLMGRIFGRTFPEKAQNIGEPYLNLNSNIWNQYLFNSINQKVWNVQVCLMEPTMLVHHRLRFVKTSSFLSRQNLVDQTLSPKLDENIGILIWGERARRLKTCPTT